MKNKSKETPPPDEQLDEIKKAHMRSYRNKIRAMISKDGLRQARLLLEYFSTRSEIDLSYSLSEIHLSRQDVVNVISACIKDRELKLKIGIAAGKLK